MDTKKQKEKGKGKKKKPSFIDFVVEPDKYTDKDMDEYVLDKFMGRR
jgi:hypothetical protein